MRRDYLPEKKILSPTESRQASPRRDNFRVLVISLLLLVLFGAVLIAVFQNSAVEQGGTTPGPAAGTAVEGPATTGPASTGIPSPANSPKSQTPHSETPKSPPQPPAY